MKKILSTALLCGSIIFGDVNPKTTDEFLRDSCTTTTTIADFPEGKKLERILTDNSIKSPKNFSIEMHVPEFLNNYDREDKKELMKKYSLMWNYEVGVTYWVIENMMQVSESSQKKIKHFGFEEYLNQNLLDKIDGINYAFELAIEKKEISPNKINILSLKSQKKIKDAGDKNPAPIIGINPINYLSDKCVNAKGEILEVKVKDNLLLINSDGKFLNYKDLVKNSHTKEEYKRFLENVIKTNRNYFNSIEKSVELTLGTCWAKPFVNSGVKEETKNADDYVIKLCNFLMNDIYDDE